MLRGLGVTLANIEDARLYLPALHVQHAFGSAAELGQRVARHYSVQVWLPRLRIAFYNGAVTGHQTSVQTGWVF